MPRKFSLSEARKNSRSNLKCIVSLPAHIVPLNVLRKNILSHGELPYGLLMGWYLANYYIHTHCYIIGWVVTNSTCSATIQFYQLRQVLPGEAPVYFSLNINSNHSWTVFLCGHEV